MPTIHQNNMTSGTHDLTGEQQAKVASLLRENGCPYLIFSDGGDDAAPTTIVVLRTWAPLVGRVLDKVLDPDKPVPPGTVAALTLVPDPDADIAEVFETFTAKAA